MGGKRKASRARNMSLEHIFFDVFAGGFGFGVHFSAGGESVCGGLLPCGCKRRTEYLRTRGVARVAQWLVAYCGVMYVR